MNEINLGNIITIFLVISSSIVFIMRLEGKIKLLQKEIEGQKLLFKNIVQDALTPLYDKYEDLSNRVIKVEVIVGNLPQVRDR